MSVGVKVGEAAAAAATGGESLPAARAVSRYSDYLELTKPRITSLVLVTTFIGFFMGSRGPVDGLLLFHALLGTALVAGGASALNQYLERNLDALMRRTRNRPLPAGRIRPLPALGFGVALCSLGVLYLTLATNLLTGGIAALTVASYLFVYTPLKRVTPLSTMIGAVPGALPPVGGWTAATGQISLEALILFGIVFTWQLPHFLAIGWIFRDDYDRAGYPMLPVIDRVGLATGRHMVAWCLALIPVSLVPTLLGVAGIVYFFGALALGLVFLGFSALFAAGRRDAQARWLFLMSIVYLPILWGLMILDKTGI